MIFGKEKRPVGQLYQVDEQGELNPIEIGDLISTMPKGRLYFPEDGQLKQVKPGAYIVDKDGAALSYNHTDMAKEKIDLIVKAHTDIHAVRESSKPDKLKKQEDEYQKTYPSTYQYLLNLTSELSHLRECEAVINNDPLMRGEENRFTPLAEKVAEQIVEVRKSYYEGLFLHNKDKKNTRLVLIGSIAAIILLAEESSLMHVILLGGWSLLQKLLLVVALI